MNPEVSADRRLHGRTEIKRPRAGFHEFQFLKLNDPEGGRALWLRLSTLTSGNGFRKVAEAWALLFERQDSELRKVALKQSFDIRNAERGEGLVKIGDCEITETSTRGTIQSKGNRLSWDFEISSAQDLRFDWVPEALARSGISRMRAQTLGADLRFTGRCELNGRELSWQAVPGLRGRGGGTSQPHSWVRGQCNSFVNERGEPVYCIFEGISGRARLLGGIPTPEISTFLFAYQGQVHRLNSLWAAFRSRSHHTFTEWSFQADHQELSFRGSIRAEHREFAGIVYEDTDGSLLHGANAQLCEMSLSIYRRGKLETTLRAPGTAALEICSRSRNPYVPELI